MSILNEAMETKNIQLIINEKHIFLKKKIAKTDDGNGKMSTFAAQFTAEERWVSG